MNRKRKKAERKARGSERGKMPRRGSGELVTGRFSANSAGFGFLHPDSGQPDVFIPPPGVANAIDGDQVEAEVYQPDKTGCVFGHPSKGPVGYVRQVLKRDRELLVGCLDSRHTIVPLDRSLPESIPVNSVPRGSKTGDWVKLRLLRSGSKHTESLRGSVEERIARSATVGGDLDAVTAEYRLEGPYTAEQEKAALALRPGSIPREDLRDLFTVTIDPGDAHDFDDAISLDPGGPNELKIGVHIADVAAWITPGSLFDKLAMKRGFSAYLPGRFLPMLPEKLTGKISLKEGADSLAHSVLFSVRRSDGKILSVRRTHSTIRVAKRLSFTEVRQFLDDPGSAPADWDRVLRDKISLLALIAKRIRARRMKQEQFLDMEIPETRAICNEKTLEVTGIERREQSDADRIVEEFMLAANSAVAAEVNERHLPALYRIHPEPGPEKIDEFSFFASASFGISTGDLLSSRSACRAFLASLPEDHRKPVLLSAFLRAMPRASYASSPDLHYGLGKVLYSHFTSPIRRYSDLLLHQQLWNEELHRRFRSGKVMEELAAYCSRKEKDVDSAFFAADSRMKLHYLKQNHALEDGRLHEAVIVKVTGGGLVCDIQDLGLHGFVPASFLRGGSYRRDPGRGKAGLAGSHTEYRPGDFIYLILDSLDFVRGSAVFRPAV